MGAVAETHADHVVLTNDNPRTELPETITNDILVGCKLPKKINVILARKKAVMHTIESSSVNDMILFAGKGHETHQEVNERIYEYSDKDTILKFC